MFAFRLRKSSPKLILIFRFIKQLSSQMSSGPRLNLGDGSDTKPKRNDGADKNFGGDRPLNDNLRDKCANHKQQYKIENDQCGFLAHISWYT